MIFRRGDDNLFGSQSLGVLFGAISTGLVLTAVWRAAHGQWGLLAGVVVVVGTIGFVLGVNALVERVDVRRGERASVPYHACPPTVCSPAGDVSTTRFALSTPAGRRLGLIRLRILGRRGRAVVPSAPVPARGAAAHGRGSGLPPASARMVRAVREVPDREAGGAAVQPDGPGPTSDDSSLTAPIAEVSS